MHKAIRATCLWAVVALALSACIPDSINPLGDPAKAEADPKLSGKWTGMMNGEPATLTVTPKEGAALELRVETEGGEGKTDWVLLDAFPAQIGKQHYVNIKFREEEGKVYDQTAENYYICRYLLGDDGSLKIWTMAEQPVVDVIADGRLNGSVEPDKDNRTIHITDSSTVLQAIVEESDPATLFGNAYATFSRAKD